jgi:hypothetical protein
MANYGRQMGSLISARMPAAQDNACRCTGGADRRWPGSALLTVQWHCRHVAGLGRRETMTLRSVRH